MSPIAVISDLHLRGKLVLRPINATSPKYPKRLFSSVTTQILRCNAGISNISRCNDLSKYPAEMLEFVQDISFMSPVIIAVISDLHLRGKLLSRPIKATSPK